MNAKDTGMAMQLTVPGGSGWEMGDGNPGAHPPAHLCVHRLEGSSPETWGREVSELRDPTLTGTPCLY